MGTLGSCGAADDDTPATRANAARAGPGLADFRAMITGPQGRFSELPKTDTVLPTPPFTTAISAFTCPRSECSHALIRPFTTEILAFTCCRSRRPHGSDLGVQMGARSANYSLRRPPRSPSRARVPDGEGVRRSVEQCVFEITRASIRVNCGGRALPASQGCGCGARRRSTQIQKAPLAADLPFGRNLLGPTRFPTVPKGEARRAVSLHSSLKRIPPYCQAGALVPSGSRDGSFRSPAIARTAPTAFIVTTSMASAASKAHLRSKNRSIRARTRL